MARHHGRKIGGREREQIVDQCVDHAVPGLERYGLALVTGTLQDERVAPRLEVAQKPPRQRGFAHAGRAVEQQHAWPLLRIGRWAIAQRFERVAASDEKLTRRMS